MFRIEVRLRRIVGRFGLTGLIGFGALFGLMLDAGRSRAEPPAAVPTTEPAKDAKDKEGDWRDLFDGKSLRGWRSTAFGGEGNVYVEHRAMMLDYGSSLTGVTYTGELPRTNYELRLEAKRLGGTDFFCGLTFPVGPSYCTLIVGGWGGAVVGLSSIDGKDASENATQRTMAFEQGKWYPIRVRVTDEAIGVWIEGKQVIDQPLADHTLSLRPEVELCRPLGICTWDTRAAIRKLQLRRVPSGERERR